MQTKICSKCKEEKSVEGFGKHYDGYQAWCKICQREASRLNRLKNLEERRAYDREYAKKNRQRKTDNFRKWRHNNPGRAKATRDRNHHLVLKWAKENKAYLREKQREWRMRNRPKIAEHDAIRRRRHKEATPGWLTKEQKREIKEIYRSAHTRSVFHEEPFHIDHIEPLKGVNEKGEHVSCGLHVPWNLQILPAVQNVRKSNKIITN